MERLSPRKRRNEMLRYFMETISSISSSKPGEALSFY
jgi:hypothetical protein